MTSLAPHMEAFLREHLIRHRGASQHTCDSYAYSFQSLFEFAAGKLKVAPSALMLEQVDATLISGFLQHLETTRGNSAETRNIRLAAIRSFFRFLQHREPAAIEQVRRVLAIPEANHSAAGESHMFCAVTPKQLTDGVQHYMASKSRPTCSAIPAQWSSCKRLRTSEKSLYGWGTVI